MDSIIIEIRAGAGGEEAALFAEDLYKMYSKFASFQGWKQMVLDSSPTGIGGVKQIVFEIKGENVLAKLKNEAGVHRVQRVPKTEKSNRVHTSTASVAVLTKPPETEININPSDIRMDFFKSSGAGGQNVNKRQTAVRITHMPSGLVVASQVERGLEDNKRAALSILQAKLFELKNSASQNKVLEERRAQIGTADRSEKIRTYNFPQDRITDHRIERSWHNMEKIMNGHLEKIVDYLQENLKEN
ncbi:MAG: PCRF domain-containing protein [Candidatus Pacebacteria bacterium]|nr:PCRF domain-containing protein [Candidatus Paceibacterota bacterium]